MLILTPENEAYDVGMVVDYCPTMYCVLDVKNIDDIDFYFKKMLFVTEFDALSAEIKVGKHVISVPLNWQILLADEESGDAEMCAIEDILNMKYPTAFVYNPYSSPYPSYEPVTLLNVFQSLSRWQMPLLDRKNLLVTPLEHTSKPDCVIFADGSENTPYLQLR